MKIRSKKRKKSKGVNTYIISAPINTGVGKYYKVKIIKYYRYANKWLKFISPRILPRRKKSTEIVLFKPHNQKTISLRNSNKAIFEMLSSEKKESNKSFKHIINTTYFIVSNISNNLNKILPLDILKDSSLTKKLI